MKKACLILFLFIGCSTAAQDKNNYKQGYALFESGVKIFIDSLKQTGIDKYNVYR